MAKKETYKEYRERTGLCEMCGQIMKDHCVCHLCGALLGEGHISPIARDKDGLFRCGRCRPAIEYKIKEG